MKTRAQFLTVVTAVLVLGAAGVAAAFYLTRPQALATTEVDSYAGQPTLGDPDAPVKLILFENFMCDHCRAFETDVFPQLRREFIDTGRVEAYYVNLAWGSEQAELGGWRASAPTRRTKQPSGATSGFSTSNRGAGRTRPTSPPWPTPSPN